MARLRHSEATTARSTSVTDSLYRDPSIPTHAPEQERRSPSSDKENPRRSKSAAMDASRPWSKRRRLADRNNSIAYESSGGEDNAASEPQTHAEDARPEDGPVFDPFQSMEQRRDIRSKFRDLERDYRDGRGEWMKPDSKGLQEAIRKQNKIYAGVKQTSDATIDSRMLVDAGDIAYKRTKILSATDRASGIDIEELVGKCITYMTNGSQRFATTHVEDDEADLVQNETLDWAFFGTNACMPFIKRPATSSFLLGPISFERAPKTPRQRRERLRRDQPVQAVRARELRAEEMSQAQSTSVTAACGRVMQTFKTALDAGRGFAADFWDGRDDNEEIPDDEYGAFERNNVLMGDGGLSLFKFVLHPTDFGQTVENIFYLSFLIKDDGIKLAYDDDGLPSLHLVSNEVREDPDRAKGDRYQQIFDLDWSTWQGLVELNSITTPMIADRSAEQAASGTVNSGGWYS